MYSKLHSDQELVSWHRTNIYQVVFPPKFNKLHSEKEKLLGYIYFFFLYIIIIINTFIIRQYVFEAISFQMCISDISIMCSYELRSVMEPF